MVHDAFNNKSGHLSKRNCPPPLKLFFATKNLAPGCVFFENSLDVLGGRRFFDPFSLAHDFISKTGLQSHLQKNILLGHFQEKRRGVYSAASGEDIVTFKSSSSNGDIVPNTVRALKGHLCELLGYNRFRQTLLTSDGVARTQDFFLPCIRLYISRNDI